MPLRFVLLALVSLVLACGKKDRGEQAKGETTAVASQPDAAPAEAHRPARDAWALHVEKVTWAEGKLSVLAGIAPPPSVAVEQVYLGLSARKPDGTVVDAPLVEVPRADLGGAQNLSHAFGPGFTEFALGVWGQAPPSCEEGQQDCPPRLSHLAGALVAYPKQDPTAREPGMEKTDAYVGVRFQDAGGGEAMRAVRKATFEKVGAAYRESRYRVSNVAGVKAPESDKIMVRHRDISDAGTAAEVAAELRKAVAGTEVGVEHVPDLDVAFSVVVGGTGTVAADYTVDAGPVRMVRPGREKAPPMR